MNDNAKALVAALRSGRYTQGKGRLTSITPEGDHRDCCLGVACKLAVEAGVIEAGTQDRFGLGEWGEIKYDKGDGSHENAILPEPVRAWLGFRDAGGSFNDEGEGRALSGLNDEGVSFDKIADLIESEPKGLFE